MSDMRFIILGVALIFVGFIILGAFGHEYQAATLESNEFISPMTVKRTLFFIRSSTSLRNELTSSFINAPTSIMGRFQFSDEKV